MDKPSTGARIFPFTVLHGILWCNNLHIVPNDVQYMVYHVIIPYKPLHIAPNDVQCECISWYYNPI